MSFKENFLIDSRKNASQLSQVSSRRFRWPGVAAVALAACYAVPTMASQSYLTPPGTQNICRVASDAPKANNNLPDAGSSWAKAYRSLGKAVNNYQSCREIWIKTGTYDTSDWHADDGITVRAGQKLLGGFKGTGYADSARWGDPTQTILDGDRYAYHTVTLKGDINHNTLFENLTISRGQADGKSSKNYDKGGGLYCNGGANEACSPTLNWVQFRANEADSYGGAVYLSSAKDVSPKFIGTGFIDNESKGSGGAVAILNKSQSNVARANFDNVYFADNFASSAGGAIFTSTFLQGPVETTIRLGEFERNTAAQGGSAIYQQSGGLFGTGSGLTNHTILEDSIFKYNYGTYGTIQGTGNTSSIEIKNSDSIGNFYAPLHKINLIWQENSNGWYFYN